MLSPPPSLAAAPLSLTARLARLSFASAAVSSGPAHAPVPSGTRFYSSSSSSRASTSTRGLKPKSPHDRLCSERALKEPAPSSPLTSTSPTAPGSASAQTSASAPAPSTKSKSAPVGTASGAPAAPIAPAKRLGKMFLASPIPVPSRDAARRRTASVQALPAMAGLLASVQASDAKQRADEAMLRRAATGALPWAPAGGKKPMHIPVAPEDLPEDADPNSGVLEAHAITWLPDPSDLPRSSELRYRLSLYELDQAAVDAVDATRDRLLDLKDLATNSRFVERVGAQVRWDHALREADARLGRGTLVPLDQPLPAMDTSTFTASLPLGQQASLWLDSTRRKRKSKMRKHKHRKLLKKMRATKIKQGRV